MMKSNGFTKFQALYRGFVVRKIIKVALSDFERQILDIEAIMQQEFPSYSSHSSKWFGVDDFIHGEPVFDCSKKSQNKCRTKQEREDSLRLYLESVELQNCLVSEARWLENAIVDRIKATNPHAVLQ